MKKKLNKSVFLLGMGKSGTSLAKFLLKKDISYYCWDDNIDTRKLLENKKFNFSAVNECTLKKCSFLVLSPGINHLASKPHEAVTLASKLRIKIITDLEFLCLLRIDIIAGLVNYISLATGWAKINVRFGFEMQELLL